MPDDQIRPIFLTDTEATDTVSAGATHVDAFERQIKELFFIENHSYIGSDKESTYRTDDFRAFAQRKEGSHVNAYYPWNRHVVKTVGAEDYFRLKTNRNQDLITAREQAALRDYKVAVFGLSVGSNIVRVLSQSGISNSITIADFDELDTTNLNRILAGVHEVGLNKAVIASRRIYEDNPFADVRALSEGITAESLESLLSENKLDCIIDEVDDMAFKVSCRKLAMKYKRPVVMITDNGDGVVLHVERYDLGLGTIFGKNPAYFDAVSAGKLSREAAGRMIMEDIVGGADRVDPAMLRSVQRVLAKELVSWSQLGSAAILGGVIATYMVKQIALERSKAPDIRAYISPASGEWGTHAA